MITDEMIERYEDYTDRNWHGAVLTGIAEDCGLDKYVNLFSAIDEIHDREGHIAADVLEVRTRYKKEMLEELKYVLDEEDYLKITRII